MNIAEAIRIALLSLWANKLRSLLTLLGVVIGIAAVIAVVTLVSGINGYVSERIFRLGADVLIVFKVSPVVTNVDQFLEGEKRKDLGMAEYRALVENCRTCKAVGASQSISTGKVAYGNQSSSDTWVRGWTPSYVAIYDLEIEQGRSLTEFDQENTANVVIIGYDIVDNLMPGIDPIGTEIRVDGHLYQVIGIGKREGKTLGMSRDNYVIMPISSWLKQYGARKSINLAAKADGIAALELTMDEARAILRARRHDMPGKPDSFAIETNSSFMGIWSSISGSFFVAMIAIAAVALVVGGIVIMNIMLVSVTERTREIGIRKALGARRKDILRQFLIESSTMAVVGGILGILVGVGLAKSVTLLIGMPSAIKLWAIWAALIVSASVGVFFGVYPARRAADLDPITALRFEL